MQQADTIITQCEDKMKKTISETKAEMVNIRTGKPNPLLLDKVSVDYYGTATPLRQIANVTSPDGQSLVIQPFDRNALKDIEKAILKSDLGITPNNDGVVIRMNFPPLTEDRRKELVKHIKKLGEEFKVAIRNVRRDATETVKKMKKTENLPEDEVKAKADSIQKLTDKYIEQVDHIISEKEKEILA